MTLKKYQTTIGRRIEIEGAGVHSGQPVQMALVPAEAGTGTVFHRVDFAGHKSGLVPALCSSVQATELCTIIANSDGAAAQTIEHLMAALSALEIDNVIVELDQAEVPVMDGSSSAFVEAIDEAGVKELAAPRSYIRVLRPVRVSNGAAWAEFTPGDKRSYDVEIEFDDRTIGRQRVAVDLTPDVFRDELSFARTFGFMRDVERLWAAGFALGSSLENAVVICDQSGVVNPEGLRRPDEFARHKLLDAIGDLSLAGAPILGQYRSHRGGHKLNADALAALLADEANYELVTFGEAPVRVANTVAKEVRVAEPV
ncbi:MAG: UDP-3-O-acyl-N-acetylglucosamine deacetylase [Pseudomonadota bacterium]